MTKKTYLIIIGVLLFLGGTFLFFKSLKKSSFVKPVFEVEPTTTEVKVVFWEDPSGFSFLYPEGIEIDPHEEDEESYAHLDLTSPDYPGHIVIWAKDTDFKDIESWAEEEAGSGQVFDTELGGESAKKIAFSDPQKMIVGAIDIDALVLIEMMPDEGGFWQKVYDDLLASFEFIPLEDEEKAAAPSSAGSTSGGGSQIIEEPEEVIE
jgi:hypothetical protein